MTKTYRTAGQVLLDDSLPADLRRRDRVLDKSGLDELLNEVAVKYPDRYKDISFALSQLGHQAAQRTGGFSFGQEHMRTALAAKRIRKEVGERLRTVLNDDSLSDSQRNEQVASLLRSRMDEQQKAVYDEALAAKNPLALQVLAGVRGNKMNLSSLLGSDMLYTDAKDRPVPFPVMRSYAEGLPDYAYWAGAYGARKGVYDTKKATADAGFYSKQLNQVAHRILVEAEDRDEEPRHPRGLPVDTNDPDNEGSLLSVSVGGYPRNTLLTPKILKDLERRGIPEIVVRSVAADGTPGGGVYARDVGFTEKQGLPDIGEFVGHLAAQSVGQKVSQGQLGSKHTGGVAGADKAVSGFAALNQLAQFPQVFRGGATHASVDGRVEAIADAPTGGKYLTIGGERHYVPTELDVTVKPGDVVEAGDRLSTGQTNPRAVTEGKGMGEGKRAFIYAFRKALDESGMRVNRRNLERIAKGLINHVRLTEEWNGYLPDDVVPYSLIESQWEPRDGFQQVEPSRAVGKRFESPVLHYAVGDRVTPSVAKRLQALGVNKIDVHDDPPPFQPQVVRAMDNLQYDPDWMTRMYGSGLKSGFLEAAHRGRISDESGTSSIPSLASSVNFGKIPGSPIGGRKK